jgi:hypothetical protein
MSVLLAPGFLEAKFFGLPDILAQQQGFKQRPTRPRRRSSAGRNALSGAARGLKTVFKCLP